MPFIEQVQNVIPQTTAPDDFLFEQIFDGEGATQLDWEQAAQCTCLTPDTKQPVWGCPKCGGSGVIYATPTQITGLFRSQGRWLSFASEGELDLGEAQLTTPLNVRPGYIDRMVRDRFTVPILLTDGAPSELRSFYPATPAVPFVFNNVQRAWRVQLQSAERAQDLVP